MLLGTVHTLHAAKEVILSAGAVKSPHICVFRMTSQLCPVLIAVSVMLSGIGDAAQLAAFNITPLVKLPVIGTNLQVRWTERIGILLPSV